MATRSLPLAVLIRRPWRTRNGYERPPSKFVTSTRCLRIRRRGLALAGARFQRAATSLEKFDSIGSPDGHLGLLRPEEKSDDAREGRVGPQALLRRAVVGRRPHFVRVLPRSEARLHRRPRGRRRGGGAPRRA